METIGQRLKLCRQEYREQCINEHGKRNGKKMSSLDFIAKEALGDDTSYNLLHYEADRAKPSFEKTKLLANFYGKTIEYLQEGTNNEDVEINSLEKFLESTIYYENRIITQYEKEFIINTLKMLRNK